MKMRKDVFNRLKQSIQPLDTKYNRRAYLTGNFDHADLVKDLDMRYRWDLFWAAGGLKLLYIMSPEECPDVSARCDNLADAHIDTALRRIVPKLQAEEELS